MPPRSTSAPPCTPGRENSSTAPSRAPYGLLQGGTPPHKSCALHLPPPRLHFPCVRSYGILREAPARDHRGCSTPAAMPALLRTILIRHVLWNHQVSIAPAHTPAAPLSPPCRPAYA